MKQRVPGSETPLGLPGTTRPVKLTEAAPSVCTVAGAAIGPGTPGVPVAVQLVRGLAAPGVAAVAYTICAPPIDGNGSVSDTPVIWPVEKFSNSTR